MLVALQRIELRVFENDVVWHSGVDKLEGHYHLALLGLQVLDLELPSAVCFPFHLDHINQILGRDIG
jgi:hypothetical protein